MEGQATNYAIAELYRWYKENRLRLKPEFQRNIVWNKKAKSYLIDSILNDFPIPEIFLSGKIESNRSVLYYVVDGQQRLRSIFDFIDNKYTLTDSLRYKGKKYSDLVESEQFQIHSFNLLCRQFTTKTDDYVWEVFRRMNRYVTPLNGQELRHATYRGSLISTCTYLSEDIFWKQNNLFSSNDLTRMINIEVVSELFLILINEEVTDFSQQNLNDDYDKYDGIIPNNDELKTSFMNILDTIHKILGDFSDTWYTRKPNFYALFLAFYYLQHEDVILPKNKYPQIKENLRKLIDEVKISYGDKSTLMPPSSNVLDYVRTLIEHSTTSKNRMDRANVLKNIILICL